MPKCCSKCHMYYECETRNECCSECDFYSDYECLYEDEEIYDEDIED